MKIKVAAGEASGGPAQRRAEPLVWTDSPASSLNGTPSPTAQQRVLHIANHVADALGLFSRPLLAGEMMSLAMRRTGLADFGDPSFEKPLQVLIKSYEDEADLSPFGRMVARWDTLRFLQNLLMLKEAEIETPAILAEPIVQPIFVTGLPRSGSTFLHHLLSQDPSNLVVRCWETIFPCPGSEGKAGTPERRVRRVRRQLARFARLAPEFTSLHPITAESPQECTEITGHVFQSLRFDTTHAVPSYRRWLDDAGHLAPYRFHKRFLQHLQHRKGPGRWILKCPDHLFALDAVRTVYPDARFIFTHRNPLEVLPSVAKLTEVLRRPFTRRIDRSEIGRQVSDRWAQGATILTETAARATVSPGGMINLRFRSLVNDPSGSVAMLYERLGLTFGREAESRVQSLIADLPHGGYGTNRPKLGDYGLDAEVEQQRYRNYITVFGV
jgi:hypothetical protein